MNSINGSFSSNFPNARPEYFFINGFSGIPYSSYYYIFLFCTYIIAVIGNSAVLLIIAVDRSLHSPKYIGVFHLALADLGETNALIPNMMKTFFYQSQYISYNACLANMFFIFFFTTMQSTALVVLAFDRLIAICLPLRYHAIVNNTIMLFIWVLLWVFNMFVISTTVSLITRLSFCKSNVINSYFCDHGPVYKLACSDTSINFVMAYVNITLYIIAPIVLIILSYLCIFFALTKITTWEGRLKAMKTCASHLLLVAVFFLPIFFVYVLSLSPNVRIICTSLSYVIPSTINPIIYVLNTAEIKDVIRKLLKKRSALVIQGTSN